MSSVFPYLISVVSFIAGVLLTIFYKLFDLRVAKRNFRIQSEIELIYQIESEVSSRYCLVTSEILRLSTERKIVLLEEMVGWCGKYPRRNIQKYGIGFIKELSAWCNENTGEYIEDNNPDIGRAYREFLLAIQDALDHAEDPDVDFSI